MLLWATEIPVRAERAVADLFDVGRRWIMGSPHTRFTDATFPVMPASGNEIAATVGGDSVTLALGRTGTTDVAGLRYVQSARDGLVWATELVGARDVDRFLISVRVSCEASSSGMVLPSPKKPIIVRLLLEQLGGGSDGDLEATDRPLFLEQADMGLAARAIRGELGNALPIVYVSASDRHTHLVSPAHAAYEWSGLAHVLVEPNRAFSFRLRFEAGGQNAYGGAIGIYWPDGIGRRVLLPSYRLATPEQATREVSEELRAALSHKRPARACTWEYLQEVVDQARYARLKEAGSKGLNDYIAEFDGEIRAKNAELARAEAEILRLKADVRRLEAIAYDDEAGGLLSRGAERDFFQGERLGIVLDAIRIGRTRLDDDSRPAHILDDILANNQTSGVSESLRQEIRELLKDFRSMSPRTRTQLEALGFEVSEDGPHIKLVFLDDPRYTFVAPKTGGDHRGGRNLVSVITGKLFSRG